MALCARQLALVHFRRCRRSVGFLSKISTRVSLDLHQHRIDRFPLITFAATSPNGERTSKMRLAQIRGSFEWPIALTATMKRQALAPSAVSAIDVGIRPFANRLFTLLPNQDRAMLDSLVEEVWLVERQVLETPYTTVSEVYFLTTGMASVVASTKPNHRLEVGMVGSEGMTGLAVVLGDDQSANLTMVQSAGTALRLSSHSLR